MSAGLSDRGRERAENEDRLFIADLSPQVGGREPAHLLAVADGVGGARGGSTASTLAIETLRQSGAGALRALVARGAPAADGVATELWALFREADRRIRDEAARRPFLAGMATTLTVAFCVGRKVFVAHVGDSRCYLLRDGTLHQLTTDQTVPAELVRLGVLPPDAIDQSPFRHVLTDYVGGGEGKLHVDLRQDDLLAGDVLLVCSDGLTDMVDEATLRAILLEDRDPHLACSRLVATANERGGRDNVTAVVARAAVVA